MKEWRIYQNYIIIAIISLFAIFVLPMLGTQVGIGLNIPDTAVGWVVYILTKLCIIVINILTLDQFIKQAKVNVRNNEKFIEADKYFNINRMPDEEELLTPRAYLSSIYRRRMTRMVIGSVLGVFGLTQAILTFDWVSMLTYLFTIILGLVYGWMVMNDVENYWTNTYYKLMERDRNERENKKSMEVVESESNQPPNDNIHDNRRGNLLEPINSNGCIGNNSQSMVVEYLYSDIYGMGMDTSRDADSISNNIIN